MVQGSGEIMVAKLDAGVLQCQGNYGTECCKIRGRNAVVQRSGEIIVLRLAKLEAVHTYTMNFHYVTAGAQLNSTPFEARSFHYS